MRNLLLCNHQVHRRTGLQDVISLCRNSDTDALYCISRDSLYHICKGKAKIDYIEGYKNFICLHYITEQQSVFLASADGDILLYNTDTNTVECVGSIEGGLKVVSWSPDEELIALVTERDHVMLLTRDFEPVNEVMLHQTDFGEGKPLTVGWGRKETQFHGTEGKSAAKAVAANARPVFSWDDRQPRVSWREDGTLFVVGCVTPDTAVRRFRVFDREGILQYTSEEVDGLEHALAWKPSGSLIASTQRKPNKHMVVFFEKNGLQHGDFTLPFQPNQVVVNKLEWNNQSTILAVWAEDMPELGSQSYIQLWTVGNYHWYMKQAFTYESKVTCLSWDVANSNRLHVTQADETYHCYDFRFITNCSYGRTELDMSVVSVVDGSKVLITPFRRAVIPPPLCAYEVNVGHPVSQVVFAPRSRSNDMCCILSNGSLTLYRYGDNKHSHVGTYSILSKTQCEVMCNWIWLEPRELICCCNISGDSYGIGVLCLDNSDANTTDITFEKIIPLAAAVVTITCYGESAALQLEHGPVLRYNSGNNAIHPWVTVTGQLSYPGICSQMELAEVDGRLVVFALCNSRLYVDNREIMANCTSFLLHSEYLVATTTQQKLACFPLEKQLLTSNMGISDRQVERGSILVTSVSCDTRVVLQMPHGNLEQIHPRVLAIHCIAKFLDSGKYRKAFELMRKQRINLNLIVDHNPTACINSASAFVSDIGNPTWLSLFLSDLRDEDVTETMYHSSYHQKRFGNPEKMQNKVNSVCDILQQVLESEDPDKYMLPILTTHVKKTPTELDLALKRIKSLKDGQTCPTMADDCLKYLLYLVDVNELYDVALGTYDFDLVMMVAEKSQKDPKEYIPFLNHLRSLETNYQRYSIDKHLKRYKSALRHISRCADEHFEECLSLIKSHELYVDAIHLFPAGSDYYKIIFEAYGDFLSSKRLHFDAALAYYSCGNFEQALESYKKNGNWCQCFVMASRLNYSVRDIQTLAHDLVETLKSRRQFMDAAKILEDYVQSPEESIEALVEGCYWDEALRAITRHNRKDLIESHLKPGISSHCSTLINNIEEMTTNFHKYSSRLAVVRAQRQLELLELADVEQVDNPNADLYSEVSGTTGFSSTVTSQISGSSNRTFRSSKNRRKMERKKLSLKEGNPYEDKALMAALHELIIKAYALRGDVQSLCHTLIFFDNLENAKSVQLKLSSLLKEITAHMDTIWPKDMRNTELLRFGPDVTANAISCHFQGGQGSHTEDEDVFLKPPVVDSDMKWQLHFLQ